MKQILPIIFLSLFVSQCTKIKSTDNSGQPFKMSKEESMRESLEHEKDRTLDPELGEVPYERLLVAQEYYSNQGGRKEKTSGAFANFQWSERGPNNVGGRTRSAIFISATKVIVAGATGGVWKTDDITASTPTWIPLGDFLNKSINISTLAQDPTALGTLYAGTGEAFGSSHLGTGIYKSTDTGATWSLLSSTTFTPPSSNFSFVAKILVSADGHVYAATKGYYCNSGGGLMKSANGGTSWTRVIGTNGSCSSGDLRGADIEENAAGDLFFATAGPGSGSVYISNKTTHGSSVGNSGNWSDITPTGSWGRIEMGVSHQTSSGVIYVACQGGSSNDVTGVYYSSNKGSSWTSRSVPTICDQGSNSGTGPYTRLQAWYDQVVQVDPTSDATVYLGGIDVVKSTNSGASFSQISTWSNYWPSTYGCTCCSGTAPPVIHADQHGFFFNPFTANAALSTNDGGLYYSTNMNASIPSWSSINTGYNVTQFYGVATHPTDVNYLLGGTQDNGSWKITTSGVSSGISASGGDGAYSHIHQTTPTYQTTQYVYNNYYLSSNSGSSFSSQSGSNSNTGRFINPSDMDDANNIVFSSGDPNYLETRSGVASGSLTRNTYNLGFNGNQLTALTVSPNNSTTLYVGDDDGNIYKITARGTTPVKSATWSVAGSGYVSSIDVWKSASGNDDSLLVTISSYGVNSVHYTANGTAGSPTWVDIDDNSTLQDMPVRWGLFDKKDPSRIYIATDLGVMGTSAINGNSTSWTMINNGQLPSVRVDQLVYDADDNLVAATHGRGIWETKNPCNLSGTIPSAAGTYTSTQKNSDGSYDCFCDGSGNLLLALDIGSSGAVIPSTGVSLQIGSTATTSWNNAGGIVTNTSGGAIMNRKWEVAPTTQPTGSVKVKYFFTNSEYSAVVSALAALTSPTTITAPTQLQFYKLTSGGTFADPHGTGITGNLYTHSGTPSTSNWTYTAIGTNHSAEYLVTSFSGGGGGGGGAGNPLPVDLTDFTAISKSNHTALLSWETARELNNNYFDVERSFDGRSFIKIGQVKGVGTSTKSNAYTFLDSDIPIINKVAVYRLKQVDYNSRFVLSEVRIVKFNLDVKSYNVYPIPSRDVVQISGAEILANVRVYNASGSEMIVPSSGNKLDISGLKSGVYFVHCLADEQQIIRKFIVSN